MLFVKFLLLFSAACVRLRENHLLCEINSRQRMLLQQPQLFKFNKFRTKYSEVFH